MLAPTILISGVSIAGPAPAFRLNAAGREVIRRMGLADQIELPELRS